jgi:hypothetical protein
MKFQTCLAFSAAVLTVVLTADATKLGLCQFDCDDDSDCVPGLWCADDHKLALALAGFDSRKANCGKVGRWKEEVCFNPKILGGSGGGGKKFHDDEFISFSCFSLC